MMNKKKTNRNKELQEVIGEFLNKVHNNVLDPSEYKNRIIEFIERGYHLGYRHGELDGYAEGYDKGTKHAEKYY